MTVIVRLFFFPCWLLLSVLLWRYSKALLALSVEGIKGAEATFEKQALVWLTIGLIILGILISFIVAGGSSISAALQQAG